MRVTPTPTPQQKQKKWEAVFDASPYVVRPKLPRVSWCVSFFDIDMTSYRSPPIFNFNSLLPPPFFLEKKFFMERVVEKKNKSSGCHSLLRRQSVSSHPPTTTFITRRIVNCVHSSLTPSTNFFHSWIILWCLPHHRHVFTMLLLLFPLRQDEKRRQVEAPLSRKCPRQR